MFTDPPNIRCSNKCANPVRAGSSSLAPTSYITFTTAIGVDVSRCTITLNPLDQVKRSKLTTGNFDLKNLQIMFRRQPGCAKACKNKRKAANASERIKTSPCFTAPYGPWVNKC